MAETIRDRVKRLCREHGITAAELERILGFGNAYISKLDKSTPSTKKLQAIADYFDVPIKWILTGEEDASIGYAYADRMSEGGYYYDAETARVAQSLYENKALSLLFDEARDAKPEDLLLTYNVLKALKDKERKGE